MLIDTDLAWAAGFLDGEGCFCATTIIQQGRKNPTYRALINAHQIVREPLDKLADMFGGHVPEEPREREWNKRPIYLWQLSTATQCATLCEALMPYLIVKHDQAELMLRYCNLIRNRRVPRGRLTPPLVARRNVLIRQLSEAKR